jgi:anthranilate phosphoribosyltransferase
LNAVLTPILAALVRGDEVGADGIAAALGEILEGRVTDVQAAGFIVALRAKGETEAELVAFVQTMQRYAAHVDVADGAIDTCGTGGDRAGTVNVSTMAALIAAGAGVKVVKHGGRASSSECGSADVLEALGVAIELGPEGVARCVETAGVGFCFAPRYHPAMRFVGPARRELAVPTTFNFVGPLANPARVRRQAVGVSDESMATKMLGTLRALGTERAMVFHGDDGLDELTTTTTSTVHELADGALRRVTVDPLDFGLTRANAADLRGADAETNAQAVRAVLAGEKGPHRDIALLNAAAALVVAGRAPELAGGIDAAIAAIDSGQAAGALAELVRVSQEAAAEEAKANT